MNPQTYKLISHIYGISLNDELSNIELGNFTLCNYSYLISNHPYAKDIFSKKFNIQNEYEIAQIDNCYIILNNISAENIKESQEIFYNHVNEFILTILYCIPHISKENNQIAITKIDSSNEIITVFDKNHDESYITTDMLNPIYIISDKLFNVKGNDKALFEFIDKEQLTELEKKIKRSVLWVGEALRKNSLIEAYLNLCVAFETLFVYHNEFIRDSLISQMTEQSAFICETDLGKRKKLVKEIKELYKLRSKIVHNGDADITEENFYDFVKIIKNIIHGILNISKQENISSSEQLRNYIIDLKFSS